MRIFVVCFSESHHTWAVYILVRQTRLGCFKGGKDSSPGHFHPRHFPRRQIPWTISTSPVSSRTYSPGQFPPYHNHFNQCIHIFIHSFIHSFIPAISIAPLQVL